MAAKGEGEPSAYFHKFSTGEISVAGMARVDQDRAKLAAEIQENILPHAIGKGLMRPGLGYLGQTHANAQGRIIPFIRSVDELATIELTANVARIWIDGTDLLTREIVSSTVADGDFGSSGGWTIVETGDASGAISAGLLIMSAPARGGLVTCTQAVSTSDAGTEHALRVSVARNEIGFRVGSSSGLDNYVESTILGQGEHSLAFTPSGTYYIQFYSTTAIPCYVSQCVVESAGAVTLTHPWSITQIKELQYDQSKDIMFLAHADDQARKIERREDERSWSLVRYEPKDGPFEVARTADVRLKSSSSTGVVTLSADRSVFHTTKDVGALFKMTHDDMARTWKLGDDNIFTDGFRVYGIDPDTAYTITITGTWAGTLTVQRSFDGDNYGFADTATTYTANGTHTFTPGTTVDNVEHWYRIGFKDGDYTSGSASIKVSDSGSSGSGVVIVRTVASSISATADVLSAVWNTTYTSDWLPGAWSIRAGYPSAVRFFDGRLWWAGEDKIWGSESDAYYAFNLDTEGAAASIQRNIATGGSVAESRWMLPLQRLIVGTSSSLVSIRANGDDGIVTATNVTLKDCSTQGVALRTPVKLDSRGIYIHRDKRTIWEIVYNFENNDYESDELTKLNEDLGDVYYFEELAVQRSPETYIWAVRSDGQCAILLYDTREKVAAWTRFVTDGDVESVCVLPQSSGPDRVFMLVKRIINGSTKRYYERLALHTQARGGTTNYIADSFQTFTGPSSSVTVSHLANEAGLVAWATNGSGAKVALTGLTANGSGVVSLGGTYTNICVGLAYTGKFKSAKLAFGAADAGSILEPKRISHVGLLLQYAHQDSVKAGVDFSSLYPLPETLGNETVAANTLHTTYDAASVPFNGTWSTDSRVCLQVSAPYPATLLGLLIKMDVGQT